MDLRGVAWGLIGGNSDWNTVVASDSRCLGTLDFASESGRVKLFITSWSTVSTYSGTEFQKTYQWWSNKLFAATLGVLLGLLHVLAE